MPNLPSSELCVADLLYGKYISCCKNRRKSKKNSGCDQCLSSYKAEKEWQVNVSSYVCSEVKGRILSKIKSKLL